MSEETREVLEGIWNDYVGEQQEVSDRYWARQQEAAEAYQRESEELWPLLCRPCAADDAEEEDGDSEEWEEAAAKAQERLQALWDEQAGTLERAAEEATEGCRAAYRGYRSRLAEALSGIDFEAQGSDGLAAASWSLTMASCEDNRQQMSLAAAEAMAEMAAAAEEAAASAEG